MSVHGRGGSGEQRIVIDPGRGLRVRQQRTLTDDDPISAPPPSLLGEDEIRPGGFPVWTPVITLDPERYVGDNLDPVRETLRLRIRPGHRPDRTARVRVYHRLKGAPEAGTDGRCWCWTITRVAYERLLAERILDSEGATYPNGERVVPPGVDPLYVPIRCGTCGTQSVECLQMECWQD